jgi:uncharacterized protein YukE
MAGFIGMDVQQVRTFAQLLNTKADELEGILNTLTSSLQSTQWVGPDRQRFESDWDGQFVTALRNVAEGLRTAGTAANGNADQQEQASNA